MNASASVQKWGARMVHVKIAAASAAGRGAENELTFLLFRCHLFFPGKTKIVCHFFYWARCHVVDGAEDSKSFRLRFCSNVLTNCYGRKTKENWFRKIFENNTACAFSLLPRYISSSLMDKRESWARQSSFKILACPSCETFFRWFQSVNITGFESPTTIECDSCLCVQNAC